MTPRLSDRIRRLERLRARPEAVIQAAAQAQLAIGWRRLYPRLRRLVKANDPLAGWYDDWAGEFAAALMLKDLRLAMQAADEAGASTPLGAHAAQLYEAFVADGHGGTDFSGIIKTL